MQAAATWFALCSKRSNQQGLRGKERKTRTEEEEEEEGGGGGGEEELKPEQEKAEGGQWE